MGGNRLLNGVAPQLPGDVLAVHDDDPVFSGPFGIAHHPVRRVVKGLAQHKNVAARDGRVVGKRQDVHVLGGDGNPCRICRFSVNRPQNDLGAFAHRLGGGACGGASVAGCAIDAQINLHPVKVADRQSGRVFKVLRKQIVAGRSAARDQQCNSYRRRGVNLWSCRTGDTTQ